MASSVIKSKMTLLWTNSDVASDFEGQTISLNLTNYPLVYIRFKLSTTTGWYESTIDTKYGYSNVVYGGWGTTSGRRYIVAANRVQFSDAYVFNTYGATATVSNDKMIPVEIYGIS